MTRWISGGSDFIDGRDAATADATADQGFPEQTESADFYVMNCVIANAYTVRALGEGIGVGMAQDNTELKAQIDTAL